jgi:hypothetical protein
MTLTEIQQQLATLNDELIVAESHQRDASLAVTEAPTDKRATSALDLAEAKVAELRKRIERLQAAKAGAKERDKALRAVLIRKERIASAEAAIRVAREALPAIDERIEAALAAVRELLIERGHQRELALGHAMACVQSCCEGDQRAWGNHAPLVADALRGSSSAVKAFLAVLGSIGLGRVGYDCGEAVSIVGNDSRIPLADASRFDGDRLKARLDTLMEQVDEPEIA